jgi:predicted NBD/HSP70 family sugar kinase
MSAERIAALDIGGTRLKACLFADGVPGPARETDTPAREGPAALLGRAAELLEGLGPFGALGVSTAGQVDTARGVIRYANENLPGYTGTDVRGFFAARFGVPCAVLNDAYAAALGEGTFGAARGFADYLCLTYGTGVGGGVVLGGRPYYGAGGSANPLLGGLVMHPEQLRPEDPFAGTYERAASASALVAAAEAVDPALCSGRALFARLEEPVVRAVLEAWLDEVAAGLMSLLHLFNVPCAVLGGGVLEQPAVLEGVVRRVRARAIPGFRDTALFAAALGNRAGLYGALTQARLLDR